MSQVSKFDRIAWRRFKEVARPFFFSEQKWKAWGLLVLLAAFSISVSLMNVAMSYVGRDFMTALSLKDKADFTRQLYRYLFIFACATPLVVFYRYAEERLGLTWRRWLTRHLLQRYLSHRAFYQLNWFGGIDNPDQRIESDIRTFTTTTLSFLLIIFNSLIALFAFMNILWSISLTLTAVVVLYAALGSMATYFLGRPLIGLNFAQLKKEADFRYKLINIRDNAESIALYRGEGRENTRARQRLKTALENLRLIIDWNRNLNFFTTGYNYMVTILPTVIVAPLYLDGKIEFGVVTQAGFAFGQVLGALSIIVLNFGSISNFAAVITRLGSFWEALDDVESGRSRGAPNINLSEGDSIQFENVSLYTPRRDQKLVEGLSFGLRDQALLINGPSGSGKSSVLRAMAGLWVAGEGRLVRPDPQRSFFVPQRPYMVLGTLRSQLLYSSDKRGLLDRELKEVLSQVGLLGMLRRVGGLDVELDWPNVLATGEQQRLAFARALLARPHYAFLDEATSALDKQSEEDLYNLLRARVRLLVSVGHRSSLAAYHQKVLDLHGDGKWSFADL